MTASTRIATVNVGGNTISTRLLESERGRNQPTNCLPLSAQTMKQGRDGQGAEFS